MHHTPRPEPPRRGAAGRGGGGPLLQTGEPRPSAAAAVRALAVLGVLAGAATGPGPAEARATVFGTAEDLWADDASFPLDKDHPEGLRAEGARVGAQWVMLECYAPW